MIEQDEVVLKSGQKWLRFTGPHRIVTTARSGEVRDALSEIEGLVEANAWHAAGFISYEAAAAFDRAFHTPNVTDFPLLWFGLYPEPRYIELPRLDRPFPGLNWRASVDRESYVTAIDKIKEFIARGKTYQVNYTMRLNSDFEGSEWDFFQSFSQNQNKYAAYVDTGRYVICSASPELFFLLEGETITGRPMKGTIKRGRTALEDRQQADWLFNSTKNRAENVMIVDMIRNDIGRIAEIGSVQVPELFTIEKYPTLFQMTSTVQGRTRASLTDIFTALFPCASITGAPKVSTMKIISELETTPRKVYTGSIGFIAPRRRAQFNVAIRTALIDRHTKTAEYGVGGGIVWDSTSAGEYDEALLKARALTERRPDFSLLETILWTPEEGYFLLEKHLARMADSAEFFDFNFSAEKAADYLDDLASGFKSAQRVRFLSDKQGGLAASANPYDHQNRKFIVRLAQTPVHTEDVFLYHKTTHRAVYEDARKGVSACDDALHYNQNDELTEFTIGNLVVELDGKLVTPPADCGLLPGVFRAHLLESGQVVERVIKMDQLESCKKIYLVNSLRKWVEVRLETG